MCIFTECVQMSSPVGGVVAYPVMQTYGILALENNSKVGEAVLGRCSISCICTSAF